MSQSLANIVIHLVFSTKKRQQLIRDEERGQLHAYMTGILNNLESPLIEINSVRDHVHILFAQSKNHAPSKIVAEVKAALLPLTNKPAPSATAERAGEFRYGQVKCRR